MILDNTSQYEGLITWTTNAAENGTDDVGDQGYSLTAQIVVGLILASLVLTGFLGNLLVIFAIFTDPVLKHKTSNRLFVSLAFADILMVLLVMTFALINDVHGRWEFGATFCLIWMCFDIMCSTASILNLCIICVDRYLQITRPMQYVSYITVMKINIVIVLTWIISVFLAFVPLLLGWHLPPPDQIMPVNPHICILEISFEYAVVSSSIGFYVPCFVILCLYLKIFLLTQHHMRGIEQQRLSLRIHGSCQSLNNIRSILSQLKATITLGVLVGVFLICWLPFFIINPIAAYCATCISPTMFQVFTWMGWANSCANPIIYPALNKDFRDAFGRKLWNYTNISHVTRTSIAMTVNQKNFRDCHSPAYHDTCDSREVLDSHVTFVAADQTEENTTQRTSLASDTQLTVGVTTQFPGIGDVADCRRHDTDPGQ